MSFDYHDLQETLVNWPSVQLLQEKGSDSLIERIRQVLASSADGFFLKADLQPLIRHLLMRESQKSGVVKNLRVPSVSPWPNVLEWQVHSISAMPVDPVSFLLTSEAWRPSWLQGAASGIFSNIYAGENVRVDNTCVADPAISDATGYSFYSSPGQRESVRAAFLIPPGDSLIVNLPTGSGKSLVGQAPALVNRQDGYLTLFVVPTVALAIDQARGMEKYFEKAFGRNKTWPLAWYGGMPEPDRSEIRRRLRDGTQRILFTSPEALTTSLLKTVFEVARNGMLQYLVIDEAHLITQWGDEFRPAFQMLAGLRNSLLEEAGPQPFRTLLLSATFTPESIDTLADLFGPSDQVQMVSAVHLRPEPRYWTYRCSSKDEKCERVLEALKYVPRPFILYVTKRSDADYWVDVLKSSGYRRIEKFYGATHDHEKAQIINAWADNEVDGIIATSAFGVGIDKDDVRTIIHATIPETLDRFYQEVGRGGRDGKPSISLLIYDESDWSVPRGMATPKLISEELGRARWEAIYESKENDKQDDCYKINLESIRDGLAGSSEEGVKWNMRTLQLMARAGFLKLYIEPAAEADKDSGDCAPTSFLTTVANVKVCMLRHDHLRPEAWEDAISFSRQKTLNAGRRNLTLMQKFLQEGCEISEVLAELYRNNSEKWFVPVTKVCGGCPVDGYESNGKNYLVPMASPVLRLEEPNLSHWHSVFDSLDPRQVHVFYDPEKQFSEVMHFIKWLVGECEVKEVSADKNWSHHHDNEWRNLYKHSINGVVVHRYNNELDDEPYSPLARITIFDESVTSNEIQQVSIMQRPMHIVFFPQWTTDPDNPLRLLSDSMLNGRKIEKLNAVINQ